MIDIICCRGLSPKPPIHPSQSSCRPHNGLAQRPPNYACSTMGIWAFAEVQILVYIVLDHKGETTKLFLRATQHRFKMQRPDDRDNASHLGTSNLDSKDSKQHGTSKWKKCKVQIGRQKSVEIRIKCIWACDSMWLFVSGRGWLGMLCEFLKFA